MDASIKKTCTLLKWINWSEENPQCNSKSGAAQEKQKKKKKSQCLQMWQLLTDCSVTLMLKYSKLNVTEVKPAFRFKHID